MNESAKQEPRVVLDRQHFPLLLEALSKRGYRTLGPTVRDGAIVYDELSSVEDLPIGVTDEHGGGIYRLKKRKDKALFGYVVGPHSWKKFLHPPRLRLWRAKRGGKEVQIIPEKHEPAKVAFIGVRPCELSAIAIQDRIFTNGNFVDPYYNSQRKNVFVVAINCAQAGGTCFCTSMNTGPKASDGFDLALTEVLNGAHYFVVEVGSEIGKEVLETVPHREAKAEEARAADEISAKTSKNMGRAMNTEGMKELLYRNYENPRWYEIDERCLTCTNCTMVCPTCFCTTIEDVTDLSTNNAERWRKWDSCFTADFSYVHGGSIRNSTYARYRQWMTHKLATWIDQFDTPGCVGCGRCITWCPVGIDITKELQAIRESESKKATTTNK